MEHLGPVSQVGANSSGAPAQIFLQKSLPFDNPTADPGAPQTGWFGSFEEAHPGPAPLSRRRRIDVVQTMTAFPSTSDAQEEIPTTDADKSPHGCTQKDRPLVVALLP